MAVNKPSSTRLLELAWESLCIVTLAGLFTVAFLLGVSKEVEIREQAVPDYCRVYPEACDMPVAAKRQR